MVVLILLQAPQVEDEENPWGDLRPDRAALAAAAEAAAVAEAAVVAEAAAATVAAATSEVASSVADGGGAAGTASSVGVAASSPANVAAAPAVPASTVELRANTYADPAFDPTVATVDGRSRPDGFVWCPTCSGTGLLAVGYMVDDLTHWSHVLRMQGCDESSVADWGTLYARSPQGRLSAFDVLHKLLKQVGSGHGPHNPSAWLATSVKEQYYLHRPGYSGGKSSGKSDPSKGGKADSYKGGKSTVDSLRPPPSTGYSAPTVSDWSQWSGPSQQSQQ